MDFLFFIAMIGLGIASVILEATYNSRLNENIAVSKGSFAAAAVSKI